MCDKELGPAIMVSATYIQEMLRQYLQYKHRTYQQMTDREAWSRLSAIKTRIAKITSTNLPTDEDRYFLLSLQSMDINIPQIYGCPKVYKN